MFFMGFLSALAGFFDTSTAATGLVAAGLTVCPVHPIPQVEVHFAAQQPFYSEDISARRLTENALQDPDSTMTRHQGWTVHGTTARQISHKFFLNFTTRSDKAGNMCLYFSHATFAITYYPAVFIAREALDKKCYADVVRAHEMQHVAIDIAGIQEYLPHIKSDMLLYLRSLGYQGFGPMKLQAAQAKQKELQKQVMQATIPMIEKLRVAVRERQSAIDTPENYLREQAKCPGDFPEIDFELLKKQLGLSTSPQAQ
ncbi:MAG: hypothetical protein D8M28_04930 [Proteobacteria bacterium]|nr:hypothetical protein [Pseudomonadota bacterium]